MVWIAYLMRMLPEAFATPARETRTYGGEELPAPREPLRRAVACQDQAEANRYLRFVCIKYDPRARNRSLIAARLIEQPVRRHTI